MRISDSWKDYELLDCTDGNRLERWGDIILIRPDPQVIWNDAKRHAMWKHPHASYQRSQSGGGSWNRFKPIPDNWAINYSLSSIGSTLTFQLKPMSFKHTGIFPEQAVNWEALSGLIAKRTASPERRGKPLQVLNLFGYTGAATLACAAAGAQVTHVDASRGMVAWGRENTALSGMNQLPIRWLVDDCVKFVQREIRRCNKYDGIILDPPSYGRGPSGEVWKLEENIYSLLSDCVKLLTDDASFILVNSYTAGLSPAVMAYMLDSLVRAEQGGSVSHDEIGISVSGTERVLPCGGSAIWMR